VKDATAFNDGTGCEVNKPQLSCIALVDIDSAYASMERVFRPDLGDRGIAILSNNDGAVVAANKAAKALGIRTGTPHFKVKDIIEKHRIALFSSNYALYGDLSNRVMMAIESMVPAYCQYSIDEAFLDLSGIERVEPLELFGRRLKQRIWDWTRLPVKVGIAPTKTLAKVASYGAKKYPATGNVVDLSQRDRQRKLMALMDVGEIWGVGSRLRWQLNELNVHTALDLADQRPKDMRRYFSVNMERTVRELNGEQCFPLDDSSAQKQQIVVSRSFGERVTEFDEMFGAVTNYTVRAAEKLRSQGGTAQLFTLFIRTSPFSADPQYSKSVTTRLPWPTDDTRAFLARARTLLESIWRPGYRYAKAGVMLGEIAPLKQNQADLFQGDERPAGNPLLGLIDRMNKKGLDIRFAAQAGPAGKMKQARLSPHYTTRFSDVPIAKIK